MAYLESPILVVLWLPSGKAFGLPLGHDQTKTLQSRLRTDNLSLSHGLQFDRTVREGRRRVIRGRTSPGVHERLLATVNVVILILQNE